MKLSTRDFGVVEVEESEIVTFTGRSLALNPIAALYFCIRRTSVNISSGSSRWKIPTSALSWYSRLW